MILYFGMLNEDPPYIYLSVLCTTIRQSSNINIGYTRSEPRPSLHRCVIHYAKWKYSFHLGHFPDIYTVCCRLSPKCEARRQTKPISNINTATFAKSREPCKHCICIRPCKYAMLGHGGPNGLRPSSMWLRTALGKGFIGWMEQRDSNRIGCLVVDLYLTTRPLNGKHDTKCSAGLQSEATPKRLSRVEALPPSPPGITFHPGLFEEKCSRGKRGPR